MKNKTLIALSMLTTLILPFTAKAGSEMHGGDSVVCFQNAAQKEKVEAVLRRNKMAAQMGYVRQDPFADINMNLVKVETLDIWETRQSTYPQPEFIEVGNAEESTKERIAVLKNKITLLADAMEDSLNGFYAPSKWLASSTGIVEIDDSHELINYTKLCIPVQIAVQTKTRIYYDARLFTKLDELNKTALILHELMYSWSKQFSDTSFNVRKYVGMLMLKDFESYPTNSLYEELSVDYHREIFRTKVNCEVQRTVEEIQLTVKYKVWGINPSACEDKDAISVNLNPNVLDSVSEKLGFKIRQLLYFFDENLENSLQFGGLSLEDNQIYKVSTVVTPFEIVTYQTILSIKEGQIIREPSKGESLRILDQDIKVYTDGYSYQDFEYSKTSDGESYLSGFTIDEEKKLKSVSGFRKMKKCKERSRVKLNAEGLVVSC